MKDKEDPRVRYTRMILKDSLIELMRERPVTKIGIKEICLKAGVSRSTFYTYYDDVFDLLGEIGEEVAAFSEEMVNEMEFRSILGNAEMVALFKKMLQYIADNKNSIQVLLSENGDLRFQEEFLQKFIARGQKMLKKKTPAPDANTEKIYEGCSVFTVYGAVGLIRYWLKKNMHIPISDLAKMLVKLTQAALP